MSFDQLTVQIPVHVKSSFIHDAITSLLHQPNPHFLIQIVNMTGNSLGLSAKNIDETVISKVLPLSSVINFGLANCKTKYFARLDYDDVAVYGRFEKQISFLESNPYVDILGTWAGRINEYGEEFSQSDFVIRTPLTQKEIQQKLIYGNAFVHSSVMFRVAKVAAFRYDEKILMAQDYDFWTRTCDRLGMANLPEVLTLYRRHSLQGGELNPKESAKTYQRSRLKYCVRCALSSSERRVIALRELAHFWKFSVN